MKKLLQAFSANLFIFLSVAGQIQCSADSNCSDAIRRFTESDLVVSCKMLKGYANSTYQTGAVCPIASMFNLIGLGRFSEGVSQNEIYATLGLTSAEEMKCVADIVNNEAYNLPDCIQFGPAVNIYANTPYPFTSHFKSYMSDVVIGIAKNLNFNDSAKSTDVINSDVASETCNKITNIINDSSIFNSSTEIVSVTAMFMTGVWEIGFQQTNEVNQFRISASQSSSQEFMHSYATYKYGHSDTLGAKVIQINFCYQAFYVWVILPDSPFDEYNVIDKMTRGVKWYYELRDKILIPTGVHVYVPKIKLCTTSDTKTFIQQATGVYSIYDDESIDLKGAFEGDVRAAVSDSVQTVCHYTDYEGCSSQNETQSNGTQEIFKADYPHIFLIFRNERVYIAGVFRQPTS